MPNLLYILLDVPPDPAFYATKEFWLLAVPALLGIVGLVIYFVRKKKKEQSNKPQ